MNFDHCVEAWVKLTSTAGARFFIVGKNRGSNLMSAGLYLASAGTLNLWISDTSGGDRLISGPSAAMRTDDDGLWWHVGWRMGVSGSWMQFLVNGYLLRDTGTNETSLQTQSGNWYVGGDGSGDCLPGRIQEVRVWSAVRAISDIQTLWNRRLIDDPELLAAQTNLRCYWPLVSDYEDRGVQALNLDLSGVASPTFTADDPSWLEEPNPVDENAPVLSGVTPEEDSQINGDTAIQFDVTDDENLVGVELAVFFGGDYADYDERIHDGTSFTPRYTAGSTRTAITDGYRYVLRRSGGWLVDPTFSVRAWDASGNVLSETVAYSRPAAGTPAPSPLESRHGAIPFALRSGGARLVT